MKRGWLVLAGLAVGAGVWACFPDLTDTVHFNIGEVDFASPPPPLVITAWGEELIRPVPHTYGWDEAAEAARAARQESALKAAQAADKAGTNAAAAWRAYAATKPEDEDYARVRGLIWSEAAGEPRKALLHAQALGKTDSDGAIAQLSSLPGPLPAYWAGVLDYEAGRFPAAAARFDVAARTKDANTEAALIMVVRSLLADGAPGTSEDQAKAAAAIDRLLADYPQSRFRWTAEGWRGRISYLRGDYAAALAVFLGQLGTAKNEVQRLNALASIRFTSDKLSPNDAGKVRDAILQNPSLLAPYLDYRVYHSEASAAELRGLASFVRDVQKAHPTAGVDADMNARLSEIALLSGDPKEALAFADESLAKAGQRADLATYVRASALRKLNRVDEARVTLEGFGTKFPKSYLTKAAGENLALVYEKQGALGKALDTYRSIGYRYDTAYLIDARLTPNALAAYVAAHPEDKERSLLVYSLGLRRLREGKAAEAAKLFASIPDGQRRKLAQVGSRDYDWFGAGRDNLYDPLSTASQIAALQPKTDPASRYRLASLYYERRNLLLYNPALWQGERNFAFGYFWNRDVATPADDIAVRTHQREHECLYHAMTICLDIAKRYPKSPWAPKALYRAATSARRLADFNIWWRKEDARTDYWLRSAQLLRQVYTTYPKDALAKNARKYEKVFLQERKQRRQARMFDGASADRSAVSLQ